MVVITLVDECVIIKVTKLVKLNIRLVASMIEGSTDAWRAAFDLLLTILQLVLSVILGTLGVSRREATVILERFEMFNLLMRSLLDFVECVKMINLFLNHSAWLPLIPLLLSLIIQLNLFLLLVTFGHMLSVSSSSAQ